MDIDVAHGISTVFILLLLSLWVGFTRYFLKTRTLTKEYRSSLWHLHNVKHNCSGGRCCRSRSSNQRDMARIIASPNAAMPVVAWMDG